ncbi:MAG TPA: tRNA preQ1(34) S-adenosylmethionine ribosyltransferase-isomerase QueA [Chloroflexota bacterium]|nr:tRNA preQ1(34) S-adenosylmethionine ribosyltransferase-isomerase QueA [Chloroflexota bacterium]
MRTDDFDYQLPPDLIAQEPAAERSHSRLMVVNRAERTISHDRFDRIGDYLRPGDLLVANRTRVIPARLAARRETGGHVELLLLKDRGSHVWEAMARPSRKLSTGQTLSIAGAPVQAQLVASLGEGQWLVCFSGDGDIGSALRQAGALPLPPYITNPNAPVDRYQTVYADRDGSVAAPTAGLHFTPELLDSLRARGIGVEFVTLHVGPGTFKPVTAERVEEHRMHAEWGDVPAEVADAVNRTREGGGRTIAVGTTSTRLLETARDGARAVQFQGDTDRFIYPGYRFGVVDGLVTNFHLPRSTLLMLVSALAGRDLIRHAYDEAVRCRYRFYSFGDAMLIL